MGYLDDARFASEFTACKRDLQGWGDERIRQRLLELGVDRDLVADVLASSGGREVERALAVLERRLVGPVDGESERRRAMGLLVRKGYSPETASDAIRIHRRLPSGSLGDLTA